jgi:predicted DNA-binding protein (MmcQ/YjbR family)
MHNIPVISLGHSATKSLYNYQLQDIEKIKPAYLSDKQAWLNHLAYSQFNKEELISGLAWEIINN